MARMSITEAARQSGITRQYMHKLIKDGTVSASTDEDGNRYIDAAELLRAFSGRLPKTKRPSTLVTPVDSTELRQQTHDDSDLITGLRVEVQLLREQLYKAEQREQQLNQHIERLTAIATPPKQIGWLSILKTKLW